MKQACLPVAYNIMSLNIYFREFAIERYYFAAYYVLCVIVGNP